MAEEALEEEEERVPETPSIQSVLQTAKVQQEYLALCRSQPLKEKSFALSLS